MDLIYATEDFVLRGQPYPGFPLLLNSEMQLVEPAHRFLIHHLLHRGRVGSRKSWATLGQHLYDYFGFLEAYQLRWDDVRRGEDHSVVAAYRDWAVDQCGLMKSTVNQRLSTITRFYRYAARQDWITALPFSLEEVPSTRPPGFLAHVQRHGPALSPDVMLRTQRRLVTFLTGQQIRKLLDAITNVTHKLMVRCGLQIGLRREEIATFPARLVFNPGSRGGTENLLRVKLQPGEMSIKGDKPRDVYISRRFMQDLWHYKVHVRPTLARRGIEVQTPLFLTDFGLRWARDGRGLYDVLAKLQPALGFHVNPHLLRHTYATRTLYALQRGRDRIDPLVFLKEQLGHASISTTMVYLHVVNKLAEDVTIAYDEEVTAMSREHAHA